MRRRIKWLSLMLCVVLALAAALPTIGEEGAPAAPAEPSGPSEPSEPSTGDEPTPSGPVDPAKPKRNSVPAHFPTPTPDPFTILDEEGNPIELTAEEIARIQAGLDEEKARIAEENARIEEENSARFAALKEQYLYKAPKQITISFVGDCTLGNTPLQRSAQPDNCFDKYIETQGKAYPFEKVRYILQNDDLTVANLEGVLYDSEKGRVNKTYNFRGPTDYVDILTLASIEAVNIGNNHSLDYGPEGEASTIRTLEAAGVHWFGVNEAADGVYVFEKDGIRFGFMGMYYSYWAKGGKISEGIKAGLQKLKDAKCDFIIACMHGGVEYDTRHDDSQQKMVNWLYKYGADMVIGHHTHTLQGMKTDNGRTIFWSLGNFSFGGNPYLNYKNPARNKVVNLDTAVVQITFSFDENNVYLGHQINLIPCFVTGGKDYNNYQPIPVTGEKADRVIKTIQDDSRPMKLQPYIEGLGALQDFIPAPKAK